MREDGRNFRDLAAHLRFQPGNFVVRLLHAELLVEFQMLFHVQLPVQVLHADVVHIEVVAGSDGADAVENIFRAPGPRNRVHHHVGIGQNLAHPRRHRIGHLLGALEGEIALQAHRNVGEIAVARLSGTGPAPLPARHRRS